MSLTVENGTGIADADSYVSLTNARAYAASYGLSLSETDADAEVQLRQGFDYIESLRSHFVGTKAEVGQETQWPRKDAYLDGDLIAEDSIPEAVWKAQVAVASAINAGLDPTPDSDGKSFKVFTKVGPIATKFSEKIATTNVPIMRKALQLIEPLLATSGGGVTTVRA